MGNYEGKQVMMIMIIAPNSLACQKEMTQEEEEEEKEEEEA